MLWIYNTPELEKSRIKAMMIYAKHLGIQTMEIAPTTDLCGLEPSFAFGTKRLIETCKDFFPGTVCSHSIGPSDRLNEMFGAENVLNSTFETYKGWAIPWPEEGQLFIAPTFAGRKNKPMTKFAFEEEYRLRMTRKFIVSPVKEIRAEYRFFVIGGRIATSSQYAKNGEMDIRRYVPQHVGMWLAPLVHDTIGYYVVDVADTSGGLRVIETNTLNSSGLYDCDIVALAEALKEYHETETE